MIVSSAWAEGAAVGAAAAGQGSAFASFIPLIIIFAIFYFLVLRPQQKRFNAHKKMLESISRGDKIVTNGGIIGKVTKVDEKVLNVEIAESVNVQIMRSMVANVLESKAEAKEKLKEKAEETAKKLVKKKIANDN